jgi:hypothetical protein
MRTPFPPIHLAAVLVLCSSTLAACNQEPPTSAEATVQLAVIPNAGQGGRPYSTNLTQEVTTTPVYAGDSDGTGVALITINVGQKTICWKTSVSNIGLPATASHIHNAPAFIRGPIMVTLSPPDATGNATGCLSGLDQALLRDILQQPEQYYVNVHTSEFPAGAVRGQLDK